jgi:hypothetical protein
MRGKAALAVLVIALAMSPMWVMRKSATPMERQLLDYADYYGDVIYVETDVGGVNGSDGGSTAVQPDKTRAWGAAWFRRLVNITVGQQERQQPVPSDGKGFDDGCANRVGIGDNAARPDQGAIPRRHGQVPAATPGKAKGGTVSPSEPRPSFGRIDSE